jgi:hypothetical protein
VVRRVLVNVCASRDRVRSGSVLYFVEIIFFFFRWCGKDETDAPTQNSQQQSYNNRNNRRALEHIYIDAVLTGNKSRSE